MLDRAKLVRSPLLALAVIAALPFAAAARDVPFVPTPDEVVQGMLELAGVTPEDTVMDLGSGDGRIVISAVRDFGAERAIGVDIDPKRIRESNLNAQAAGVTDKVEFREQDLFKTDLSEADVVTMYLLSGVNERLKPKLMSELKPGARIVSHDFDMGEWKPDRTETVAGRTIYLWQVPQRIEGNWQVEMQTPEGPERFVMQVRQQFKDFAAVLQQGEDAVPVEQGRIDGEQLSFQVDDGPDGEIEFQGQMDGDRLSGTAEGPDGAAIPWQAERMD